MNTKNTNPEADSKNVIIALDNPRLTDEDRQKLFEIGANIYGAPNWTLGDLLTGQSDNIEHIKTYEDVDLCLTEKKIQLAKRGLTYDELLHIAALLMLETKVIEEENQSLKGLLDQCDLAIKVAKISLEDARHEIGNGLLELMAEADNAVAKALVEGARFQKTYQARKAALAKLANDPKQAQKTSVFECWQEWQKKPANYKGKAAFARDMLTKYEHLTSQKIIEDWCREWGREK
ncbi:MAG: hypothetical protein ACYCZH_14810 [Sulfuriferula sp.]